MISFKIRSKEIRHCKSEHGGIHKEVYDHMKSSSESIKQSKQQFDSLSTYASAFVPNKLSFVEAKNKVLLPPQAVRHKGKKTLVLDLDQTLIYSRFENCNNCDFKLKVFTSLPLARRPLTINQCQCFQTSWA